MLHTVEEPVELSRPRSTVRFGKLVLEIRQRFLLFWYFNGQCFPKITDIVHGLEKTKQNETKRNETMVGEFEKLSLK